MNHDCTKKNWHIYRYNSQHQKGKKTFRVSHRRLSERRIGNTKNRRVEQEQERLFYTAKLLMPHVTLFKKTRQQPVKGDNNMCAAFIVIVIHLFWQLGQSGDHNTYIHSHRRNIGRITRVVLKYIDKYCPIVELTAGQKETIDSIYASPTVVSVLIASKCESTDCK